MAISVAYHKLFPPSAFNTPAEGVYFGIGNRRKGSRKLEWWGYQKVEEVLR